MTSPSFQEEQRRSHENRTAGATSRYPAHRLRAVQSTGAAISDTSTIDEKTTFESTDVRNVVPRFTEENRKANLAFVDWLKAFARRKNPTPAQIALARLLAPNPWIVPIPGRTKRHRLDENVGSHDIHLIGEDLREIDRATSQIEVQGARYPEPLLKMVGR